MMGCGAWRAVLWARADGALDHESQEDLQAHLGSCAACAAESARIDRIHAALALSADEEAPGAEALDRVRTTARSARSSPTHPPTHAGPASRAPGGDIEGRAGDSATGESIEAGSAPSAPGADILAPRDLAALLGVSTDEIYAHLDELPAFELGGHIRFRRSAVEAWIAAREERWRRQSLAASLRKGIISR